MLQLGLLRVITWPGSRFKKQRIKAQIICTHPLFVMFFKPKLSWSCVRPCSSLCPNIPMMVRMLTFYFEKAVISLLRVCRSSFLFDFVIPVFCLDCFFCDYSQRDAPVFVSLLHRFWLVGLLFWEMVTACLYDYSEPSLSFILEGLLGCYSLCTGINWENYPAPGYD